ncbi:MAG: YdcF family protein [Pseudomonadota bacterium]
MRNKDIVKIQTRIFKPAWIAVIAVGIFSIALTGMYANFAWQVRSENTFPDLSRADAIVVLTGEDSRIKSAVDLLSAKQGQRLLISGVNRTVSKATLEHTFKADTTAFSCCVDLDYLSLDTKGNAENASYWAKYHDFTSLIVVTSDYHMPRSLLMMQRAMPQVRLIPAPVPSPELKMANLLQFVSSPIILKEFGKYLIVQLRMEPAAKYLITTAYSVDHDKNPG